MPFIRGMTIRQHLILESGIANLARKVTVCSQMGTGCPETQVSGDKMARETMALLCLSGSLMGPTCLGSSRVSLLPPIS